MKTFLIAAAMLPTVSTVSFAGQKLLKQMMENESSSHNK